MDTINQKTFQRDGFTVVVQAVEGRIPTEITVTAHALRAGIELGVAKIQGDAGFVAMFMPFKDKKVNTMKEVAINHSIEMAKSKIQEISGDRMIVKKGQHIDTFA